ncbi:hypothetical protein EW145_g8201 [Phellinidium pouzarii]|uniref:Uncharacterized protein n=1 Tax=Phellinidium pouzarii TaxID=167371 RepID=A0A4S4K9F7_9AGAM|nr:hypothetical protein EW145_g8201 [Phellinidium pouzarii]
MFSLRSASLLVPSARRASTRSAVAHSRLSSTVAKARGLTLPSFSMQNKVCLVTGAARGLGNEFCRAFVESGCTSLAIVDLKEEEAKRAADELKAEFEGNGHIDKGSLNIMGIACDVSSEVSVQKAFKEATTEFGRIDSVVASAGIVENYSAFDYPFDRIKRLYDINVHGAFFTAREAARRMIPDGGGSIVLVASMSAQVVNVPQPQTPYNASKAAVRHMASSLAVEWAKKNVRVNTLSPGYMLTKLTRTILEHDQELKRTWEALTPMGRMGDPEDLKGAVIFLASDASKFVTGSEVRVDGGYCVI